MAVVGFPNVAAMVVAGLPDATNVRGCNPACRLFPVVACHSYVVKTILACHSCMVQPVLAIIADFFYKFQQSCFL